MKITTFISGAVFGFVLQTLATQNQFQFLWIFIFGILVFAIIDLILDLVVRYKVKLERKKMIAFFEIAKQELVEKQKKEIENTAKEVIKNLGDRKKVKNDFVYKSKFQSMTKKDLQKYIIKHFENNFSIPKLERGITKWDYIVRNVFNYRTDGEPERKKMIDYIVKNKWYITRKKSDNPNL